MTHQPPPGSWQAVLEEDGSVVLPPEVLRLLGVKEGDRITLEEDGNEVRLVTQAARLRRAQAWFKTIFPGEGSVVDEFIAEKRAEVLREAEEDGE